MGRNEYGPTCRPRNISVPLIQFQEINHLGIYGSHGRKMREEQLENLLCTRNKNPGIWPCVRWPGPALPSHIVQIASVLELWPRTLGVKDGSGKLRSGASEVKKKTLC